jgi:hypothetical protein
MFLWRIEALKPPDYLSKLVFSWAVRFWCFAYSFFRNKSNGKTPLQSVNHILSPPREIPWHSRVPIYPLDTSIPCILILRTRHGRGLVLLDFYGIENCTVDDPLYYRFSVEFSSLLCSTRFDCFFQLGPRCTDAGRATIDKFQRLLYECDCCGSDLLIWRCFMLLTSFR